MHTMANMAKQFISYVALALAACGGPADHQTQETNTQHTPDVLQQQDPTPTTTTPQGPSDGEDPPSSTESDSGPVNHDSPNLVDCPTRAQKLLTFDYRSGWWSGGGGQDFYTEMLPIVASTCGNTSIEYHHILRGSWFKCVSRDGASTPECSYLLQQQSIGPGGTDETSLDGFDASEAFEESDWNNYTQIWVLSGSEFDPTDIGVTSELFSEIIGATKSTCRPFLLGGGSGFVTHANAAAEELGLGSVMATDLPSPNLWTYHAQMSYAAETYLQTEAHVLFTDLTTLPDAITRSQSMDSVRGDRIVSNPLVKVIARDDGDGAAIGVGRLQATESGEAGRPFVIDAGFQRSYLAPQDDDVRRYLQNLINYLGSIGCNSEEHPPPEEEPEEEEPEEEEPA